jgi:glucosamine-6-phosphate deaminase
MNVLRFDSQSAWVRGVATWWRDRLHTHPRLTMCLPTGLTPNAVYAEVVRSVREGQASFAGAAVWSLDEFGDLSPDDPGGLTNTLRRHLIDEIDLPADAFHFLDPSRPDIDRQCAEYGPAGGFDLVLLGIGLNGHVGMNEPGSSAGSPTRRVDLDPATIQSSARYFNHDKLPTWGITVGLAPILAAREVWLLAHGSSKADIVRRTVRDDINEDLPASLLRYHSHCSLFVDAEAAALV